MRICNVEKCERPSRGKLCYSHEARKRKYGDVHYGERESIYGNVSKQIKDGRTSEAFYTVWTNMKSRCYNSKTASYKHYGYRGIKICDRWLYDVRNFIDDMGSTYFKGATLDRIDVNGDYEPNNCRWVTYTEQANNKRSNRLITYKDKTQTLEQWIRELKLKSSSIRQRIYCLGWSVEEAFEIPKGRRRISSSQN